MKCKPWMRHFQPPKFQCFSSPFALHGLRGLEYPAKKFGCHGLRETHTELFSPHLFTWKISTSTLPEDIWTQNLRLCSIFLLEQMRTSGLAAPPLFFFACVFSLMVEVCSLTLCHFDLPWRTVSKKDQIQILDGGRNRKTKTKPIFHRKPRRPNRISTVSRKDQAEFQPYVEKS